MSVASLLPSARCQNVFRARFVLRSFVGRKEGRTSILRKNSGERKKKKEKERKRKKGKKERKKERKKKGKKKEKFEVAVIDTEILAGLFLPRLYFIF